jgi:hypothetical protein
MTVMLRSLLILLAILSLGAGLSACGMVRGASEVDSDVGGDAMGKGPGMLSGKRGGVVIYQK